MDFGCYFMRSFYLTVSFVSAGAAGALTFVLCDKSKQKRTFSQEAERFQITANFLSVHIVWDKKQATALFLITSIGDFQISALILREGVLPYLSIEVSFMECDRYFYLSRSLSSSATFAISTLYQLSVRHSIAADDFVFFGWCRVGLMGMFRVSHCKRWEAAPLNR